MASPYYTKAEDGSFHLVTDLPSDVVAAWVQSTINSKLETLIDAALESFDIKGKVEEIVGNLDLASDVDRAIDDIDVTEMVRKEVEFKIENMDVSVDVSI
jgi:hypothetical protein